MRSILAVAMLASLGVNAQIVPPIVDLDKPGALATLEKENPEHYRTVLQTVHATEKMNCALDLKAYRAALADAGDAKKACRSHLIRTSYPAQIQLWIPVDKSQYTITAYLDHSADRIEPATFVRPK